jgi:formylglycine-generating enzyme required for sulfatase activity
MRRRTNPSPSKRWLAAFAGASALTAAASCAQIAGIEDWKPLSASLADASLDTATDMEASGPDGNASETDSSIKDQLSDPVSEASCTTNALRCNGAKLQTCQAGGWLDKTDCIVGNLCEGDAGVCTPPTCQLDTFQCVGADLQQCNATLDGWTTTQTCGSAVQCDPNAKNCSGKLCVAGEFRCNGANLETCNATIDGWNKVDTCLNAGLCDKLIGVCNQPSCSAGQIKCEGNLLQTCKVDLTGWDTKDTCVDASLCDPTAQVCRTGWSCHGGLSGADKSCGASGTQDCCASATIPAGPFYRSYDAVTFTVDKNPATISAFQLNLYEVTVGRFRAFVDAGLGIQSAPPAEAAGASPFVPGSGWQAAWNTSLKASKSELTASLQCDPMFLSWTDLSGPNEYKPINCVSWFEAFAFCVWDGGRLPTEAEWNYASAGGAEQRPYPWGSGIGPTNAAYACLGSGNSTCEAADLLTVGSLVGGVGKWGHFDLAGNVSEWTFDAYALAYDNPCADCAHLDGTDRSIRGGAFDDQAPVLFSSARAHKPPTTLAFRTGFRCAK